MVFTFGVLATWWHGTAHELDVVQHAAHVAEFLGIKRRRGRSGEGCGGRGGAGYGRAGSAAAHCALCGGAPGGGRGVRAVRGGGGRGAHAREGCGSTYVQMDMSLCSCVYGLPAPVSALKYRMVGQPHLRALRVPVDLVNARPLGHTSANCTRLLCCGRATTAFTPAPAPSSASSLGGNQRTMSVFSRRWRGRRATRAASVLTSVASSGPPGRYRRAHGGGKESGGAAAAAAAPTSATAARANDATIAAAPGGPRPAARAPRAVCPPAPNPHPTSPTPHHRSTPTDAIF